MGRKPVLGLVGACLASVALSGCGDSNKSLWPGGTKKDTTAVSSSGGGNPVWNSQRQSQTPAGERRGTAGPTDIDKRPNGYDGVPPTGTAGASVSGGGVSGGTGGGSFNVNPRGPQEDYPSGRSIPSPAGGGTGSVDRVGFGAPAGPDVTGGRTTVPPATATNNFGDSDKGNLSPTVQPTTGGAGGLPPLGPPGGAAVPRTDDPPLGRASRPPVIVPPPTPGLGAGGAGATTTGDPPSPAPVPVSGVGSDLPAIPPPGAPPVDPTTTVMRKRSLPHATLPYNVGVPTSPVQPATMPPPLPPPSE